MSAPQTDTATPDIADLLARRYGVAAPAAILSTPIIEQALAHRSVRAFTAAPLPENTLETLVAAAQSASSSSNLQLWSVVAVDDPDHKSELATLANDQAFIRQAPLFLVWLADLSRARAIGAACDVTVEGTDFLESLLLGVIDAALAAQNAALALESLGLGVVYVGAIRDHVVEVAKSLKLPPYVFPVFGLAVGHPDPDRLAAVKPRLPQQAVLHRDTYDASAIADAAATYDAVLDEFWREQSVEHPAWTQHILRRMARAETLRGRKHLREHANTLGFPLR